MFAHQVIESIEKLELCADKPAYRVERFSITDNSWVKSSTHRNEEHATINMEVLVQGGKSARVIHKGRIIAKGEK